MSFVTRHNLRRFATNLFLKIVFWKIEENQG
jgi:hypothetical protein